ncbi:MAG TPA: S1 RNA-binding domain-containing protein [Chloroflexota bacterium]|nr:S1 RNA-binding domain-containing protein [Chloroflexota bacterium]
MQPIERPGSESDTVLTDPPSGALPSSPRSATVIVPVPVVEADEDDMASLMAASDQELHSPRRGELIEGVVVSMDRDGILVDVGSKSEGLIPPSEIEHLLPHQQPHVGDTIYVVVTQPEGRSEHALLSLSRAREERGWAVVQTRAEAGTILNALVLEVNRGGVVVDVEGLRGFIPLSQIARIRSSVPAAGAEPDAALAELVGQTMSVKVLEVNRSRNRLILSERLAVQELRGARREQLLAELKEGEIRHGRVTGLAEFGAFVDIGGTDGLVHLSELAWYPVANAAEIVAVGDEVDVVVLGVDRERQKVSLSIRRTQPEPWTLAGDRYVVGSLVTGKIARLTTFGAFVRLDDGIEGLIHVSELSDRHIVHPRNVVKEGDVVTVRVLRVEAERRRLGLSLRQAVEPDVESSVMSFPDEE